MEELMQLERCEKADNNNSISMAFVLLGILLIAWIFPHKQEEEKAEKDVAQEFHNKTECCTIEYKGYDATWRARESLLNLHKNSSNPCNCRIRCQVCGCEVYWICAGYMIV